MSKALTASIALLVAAILQVSLAPHIAVFGVVPNFFFLVVVTLAFIGTSIVGPYALVLSVVGYATGMLSANLFAEGWLLPVTIVAVASLSAELANGIVLAVLGLGATFWRDLVTVMIPSAVYHTVLAVLAYPWLARILRAERPMRSFRRLA
jgi:cell shape-determining protein MreD